MIKRSTIAVVAVLATLAAVSLAEAKTARHRATTHSLNGITTQAVIASTGNPPLNGSDISAGRVQGAQGIGATLQTTNFGPQLGTFSSTFTVFFAGGTFKGSNSGTGTIDAQGNTTFSGTGKVLSGTGAYQGARGTFTFSGTQAKGSSVATFTIKGTAKY